MNIPDGMMTTKALVVLSGGQDSCTCLYWAKAKFSHVSAVTFNYNQRHAIEIEAALTVAKMAGVDHEIISMGPILKGSSPLVNPANKVGHYASVKDLPGGVEPTFIPMRNLLFLTVAANRMVIQDSHYLVTGICQADYGGYPDCRLDFADAAEAAISQAADGKDNTRRIVTPLMHLSKKDTVLMAKELPGCWEALAYTHTCYDGSYPPNPHNHASLLRARGFHEADLADPLIERAIAEKRLPPDYPKDGLVEGTKYAGI